MRATRITVAAVSLVAITLATSYAVSADKKSTAAAGAPSQEEIMAALTKYGTPGPEHERLKQMVGTFDAEVSMQMAPDAPSQVSRGKMVNKSILGGRFIQGDFSGEFAGAPFSGMSLFGYDRLKKKYTSTWLDSMSTGIITAEGDADAAGKSISVGATYDCPITQGKKTMRQVVTFVDADHHTLESYDLAPDGKEFKTMTIRYSRAKE